jgi:hypothetical protein
LLPLLERKSTDEICTLGTKRGRKRSRRVCNYSSSPDLAGRSFGAYHPYQKEVVANVTASRLLAVSCSVSEWLLDHDGWVLRRLKGLFLGGHVHVHQKTLWSSGLGSCGLPARCELRTTREGTGIPTGVEMETVIENEGIADKGRNDWKRRREDSPAVRCKFRFLTALDN